MSTLRPAAFAAAGVLAMLPAGAHHALAVQYHVDREITVDGVVERLMLGNPHVRIQLRVQGANGGESWIAEGRPHTALLRNGWTGSEIEPGTRVTIVGHPAKDGSSIVVLRRAYLPDGREVWGTRADDSR